MRKYILVSIFYYVESGVDNEHVQNEVTGVSFDS
jgi:hypothetical protein